MSEILYSSIVYIALFRLSIIVVGTISIVLGYRLFCKGVFSDVANSKGTGVTAEVGGSKFTLQNAAPGTCFALFGVIIISTMFAAGGPQVTLKEVLNKAQLDSPTPKQGQEGEKTRIATVRGNGSRSSLYGIIQKGKSHEESDEITEAVNTYEDALLLMATPMNQLAWHYYNQKEYSRALAYSRMAAQTCPDNAVILHTLAMVLYAEKEYGEALDVMRKADRLRPGVYTHELATFEHSAIARENRNEP